MSLTEHPTASPGAVDLTILHSEAVGRMRVLTAVVMPCLLIAVFIAMAVWL